MSYQILVKNSYAGAIKTITTTLIMFVIVAFSIRTLGNELYGLWSLGAVITSLANIGEMGIGKSIIRFVAQYQQNKDGVSINQIINTSLFMYVFTCLLLSTILLISKEYIIQVVFNLPARLHDQAKIVISGVTIIFCINIISSTFVNVLNGFQRMEISNSIILISFVVQSILIYVTLSMGFSLKGMIFSQATAILLTGLLAYYYTHRIFSNFSINPHFITFSKLREILSYSLQMQAASIIALGFDPFLKILITNLASVSYLTYYDVSNKIIGQIRSLFVSLLFPLLPAASELSVDSMDKLKVKVLHFKSIFYVGLIGSILLGILFGLMPSFISLWLGQGYDLAAQTFRIVSVGFFFSLLATPAYVIFAGCGYPKYLIITQSLLVVINLFLGILFGNLWGYIGIMYGVAISYTLSNIFLIYIFDKSVFPGETISLMTLFKFFIFSSVSSFISLLVYDFFKTSSYFLLIVSACLGVIIYICFLLLTKTIGHNDLILIKYIPLLGSIMENKTLKS